MTFNSAIRLGLAIVMVLAACFAVTPRAEAQQQIRRATQQPPRLPVPEPEPQQPIAPFERNTTACNVRSAYFGQMGVAFKCDGHNLDWWNSRNHDVFASIDYDAPGASEMIAVFREIVINEDGRHQPNSRIFLFVETEYTAVCEEMRFISEYECFKTTYILPAGIDNTPGG